MDMDVKQAVPYAVVVFCILAAVAGRTIADPTLGAFSSNLEHTVGVILNFSIVVGVIMQLFLHSRNISSRKPNQWGYSIATIATFLVFIFFALAWGGTGSAEYQGLYKGTLIPAHWAAEGFLLYLFFNATFRGYRARSVESAFMVVLTVASFIAVGPATRAVFEGAGIYFFSDLYTWLVGTLSTGVNRGLLITTMVGSIAFMIRVLLGRQRIMGA